MTLAKNSFSAADQHWMQQALELAQQAATLDEVPVGAIIVLNEEIIGSGFNQPIREHDPTAHAEIIAMRQAAKKLKNYRLVDTTMYVTLEPCPMCAGAMLHARLKRLVFAAADPKAGALGSAIDLFSTHAWNHKLVCESGLLAEPCGELLREFFRKRR